MITHWRSRKWFSCQEWLEPSLDIDHWISCDKGIDIKEIWDHNICVWSDDHNALLDANYDFVNISYLLLIMTWILLGRTLRWDRSMEQINYVGHNQLDWVWVWFGFRTINICNKAGLLRGTRGPCGPHDRIACGAQAYPCGPQGIKSVFCKVGLWSPAIKRGDQILVLIQNFRPSTKTKL